MKNENQEMKEFVLELLKKISVQMDKKWINVFFFMTREEKKWMRIFLAKKKLRRGFL